MTHSQHLDTTSGSRSQRHRTQLLPPSAVRWARTELADKPEFATVEARTENEDELESVIAEWTKTKDKHVLAIEASQAARRARSPSEQRS